MYLEVHLVTGSKGRIQRVITALLDGCGQDLVEYALILSVVSLGITAGRKGGKRLQ